MRHYHRCHSSFWRILARFMETCTAACSTKQKTAVRASTRSHLRPHMSRACWLMFCAIWWSSGAGAGGDINEHVLNLLFSSSSALPELFCICFVVFDVTWKELQASLFTLDKVLDELRLRAAALITQFQSIRAMKEAIGLVAILAPTDAAKAKKLEPSARELVMDFNEVLADLFASSENLMPTVTARSGLSISSASVASHGGFDQHLGRTPSLAQQSRPQIGREHAHGRRRRRCRSRRRRCCQWRQRQQSE